MASFYVRFPSGAVTPASANPSVGANGSAAPAFSTEIGFIDGSGNEQGVSATNPLPVTVTSSALPTGSATAANQVTQEATLTAIQANQTNGTQTTIVSNFPATQPVSGTVTANQGSAGGSAWPVSVSGVATAANQATEIASLSTIATNSGTQATAANQSTANSSLSTIATNSGTQATAANQTTIISGISTSNSSLATIVTNTTLATTCYSGQKTSTGTAVAISTSQALVTGVIVQALATNVGNVYVGPTGVLTTTGFQLQPGQATSIAINNLSTVFIIAATSGDGVCYVGS